MPHDWLHETWSNWEKHQHPEETNMTENRFITISMIENAPQLRSDRLQIKKLWKTPLDIFRAAAKTALINNKYQYQNDNVNEINRNIFCQNNSGNIIVNTEYKMKDLLAGFASFLPFSYLCRLHAISLSVSMPMKQKLSLYYGSIECVEKGET